MTADQQLEKTLKSLEKAKKTEPELASYYEFYQQVFRLQGETRAAITHELELADTEVLQQRLIQGLPQISFSQLPIDSEAFTKLALALVDALFAYQGFEDDALDETDLDWVEIARGQFTKKPQPAQPTLVEMAAELATVPYLEWAAGQIKPHLEETNWHKGSCPVCGGEPNFAYLESDEGARWLICTRCRTEWRHKRMICPFCENKEPEKLKYFPAGEKKNHRIYVCDACLRYLKAVDLRTAGGKVVLMAEPVLRWSLDKAAREKGYA